MYNVKHYTTLSNEFLFSEEVQLIYNLPWKLKVEFNKYDNDYENEEDEDDDEEGEENEENEENDEEKGEESEDSNFDNDADDDYDCPDDDDAIWVGIYLVSLHASKF